MILLSSPPSCKNATLYDFFDTVWQLNAGSYLPVSIVALRITAHTAEDGFGDVVVDQDNVWAAAGMYNGTCYINFQPAIKWWISNKKDCPFYLKIEYNGRFWYTPWLIANAYLPDGADPEFSSSWIYRPYEFTCDGKESLWLASDIDCKDGNGVFYGYEPDSIVETRGGWRTVRRRLHTWGYINFDEYTKTTEYKGYADGIISAVNTKDQYTLKLAGMPSVEEAAALMGFLHNRQFSIQAERFKGLPSSAQTFRAYESKASRLRCELNEFELKMSTVNKKDYMGCGCDNSLCDAFLSQESLGSNANKLKIWFTITDDPTGQAFCDGVIPADQRLYAHFSLLDSAGVGNEALADVFKGYPYTMTVSDARNATATLNTFSGVVYGASTGLRDGFPNLNQSFDLSAGDLITERFGDAIEVVLKVETPCLSRCYRFLLDSVNTVYSEICANGDRTLILDQVDNNCYLQVDPKRCSAIFGTSNFVDSIGGFGSGKQFEVQFTWVDYRSFVFNVKSTCIDSEGYKFSDNFRVELLDYMFFQPEFYQQNQLFRQSVFGEITYWDGYYPQTTWPSPSTVSGTWSVVGYLYGWPLSSIVTIDNSIYGQIYTIKTNTDGNGYGWTSSTPTESASNYIWWQQPNITGNPLFNTIKFIPIIKVRITSFAANNISEDVFIRFDRIGDQSTSTPNVFRVSSNYSDIIR